MAGPAPVVLSLAVTLLAWLGAVRHPQLVGAGVLMSLVSAFAAIAWGLDRVRLRRASTVVVHDEGLLIERAGGAEVVGWDELTALEASRQRRLQRRPSVVFVPGVVIVAGSVNEWHWVIRVRARGEILFEVSDAFEDERALLAALRSALERREVPRLLSAFARGEPARLGAVRLEPTGCVVGGVRVPWTALHDTDLDGPWLVLLDAEGRALARVLLAEVPNAHLLVPLAAAIREAS